MSASAGRVLLMPKGEYDTTVTYKPLDIVKYGVSSYVCILQTQGNVPTNTTYWQVLAEGIANITPEELGIGYGIASGSGTDRTATLTDYELVTNGIVAVTFAVDVPANATLNINSEGAKAIYYRGSALVANVIRGGDTVTFAYDGTRYNVLCIDGGAGHEIENSAGTKLTQRDVMQFIGGLKATDDSINQKSLIDDTPDYITFNNWNAKSDAEKNTYIAEHEKFAFTSLPDTQGVINAEYMKLLWENPNTTQAFAPQTINLNSADYDFLMFIGIIANAEPYVIGTPITPKGSSALFSYGIGDSRYRTFHYVSDTSYSVDPAYNGSTQNNAICIPIAIYGIKASFQFKVNAIATELSTSASHCFLSDETTTVEDKFDEITSNNINESVNLSSYTSNFYECPCDGYAYVGNTSSGNNGVMRIYGNNAGGEFAQIGGSTGLYSAYVKKGMKLKVSGTSSGFYFIKVEA